MSKLDNFKKVFSQEIIKIELEHLDYVNSIINVNGNRLDKSSERSEKSVFLSLESLQEINIIAHTLHHLDKKGITSSTYILKVRQYNNLCSKLYEEFGVVVTFRDENGANSNGRDQYLFNSVPFSNPAELFEQIDIILIKHNLEIENKKNFYLEFFNRERIPRQDKVHKTIERQKNKIPTWPIVDEEWIDEEFHALFISLPREQREAIVNSDYTYQYDENYYITMKKYQLKQIPKDILKSLQIFDVDDYHRRQDMYIDADNSFANAIHFHNFLNYPACLRTEAEFLNKKLDTDKYISNMLDDGYDI